MNFAAMVLSIGVAGAVLAYNMQGTAVAANDTLVSAMQPSPEITGTISAATAAPTAAVRLIDLRSGATCKMMRPDTSSTALKLALIGPDCASAPHLAEVAFWRTTESGSLIMTDRAGETVLEFAPGDGVLYESVYPSNEIMTIVPART
ncbi:hypothetical protein [Aureimonas mangrovi]|uniref:hypothetical protein n=1 Tax=Aureimonas mangrovi TaxID=2758041 RepID=UPI00163D75D4|nr:hypothetical protein [Aureimonas mangrovi]